MPVSKIPDYIEQRIAGVAPEAAALAVGYSRSGIRVTICNLEARADVKKAIRSGKRVGKRLSAQVLKQSTSKRQYRSVADEPDGDDVPEQLKPWALKDRYSSPLDLMIDVMNNKKAPGGLRIQCAKDAMPYCHARKEGSKKDDDKSKAKETAAKSKFGAQARPSHLQRVA